MSLNAESADENNELLNSELHRSRHELRRMAELLMKHGRLAEAEELLEVLRGLDEQGGSGYRK